MSKYKPILLIILDGWGISPSWGGNALAVNSPRNINRLWRDYPHKVLQAFTLVAGKYGVVGDSRLGHSTIAAGRRLEQDLEIISESIKDNSFYHNKILIGAIEHCKKYRSNLHLVGLMSNGGIHSHLSHLIALLELAGRQNFTNVFVDAITDGIDTGPNDGLGFAEKVNQKFEEIGLGQFSTLIGRMYAMDRIGDKAKTAAVLDLLLEGKGQKYPTAYKAISENYHQKLDDFRLGPCLIENHGKATLVKDNDAVINFNFRADRSLQLVEALIQAGQARFLKAKRIKNLHLVTMTEYQRNLPVRVAFPKAHVIGTLGEVLAGHGEKQLRIAESEKAAHVTSFFNCGNATAFAGEQRQIIPSHQTDNQAKDPVMQTPKIEKAVSRAVLAKAYDLIVVNLANVDMISHTGNIFAAGKAIKTVDQAVQKMVEANLKVGGATIVTADHGNIEEMVKLNPDQDPETKHTLNPVPFILITPDNKKNLMKSALSQSYNLLSKIISAKETLADVAPTILELMELPKSPEMTGHSLLNSLE